MLRRVLLVPTIAVDAVGEALQDRGAVGDEREHPLGDAAGVGEQVGLGDRLVTVGRGEQDLVGLRNGGSGHRSGTVSGMSAAVAG